MSPAGDIYCPKHGWGPCPRPCSPAYSAAVTNDSHDYYVQLGDSSGPDILVSEYTIVSVCPSCGSDDPRFMQFAGAPPEGWRCTDTFHEGEAFTVTEDNAP